MAKKKKKKKKQRSTKSGAKSGQAVSRPGKGTKFTLIALAAGAALVLTGGFFLYQKSKPQRSYPQRAQL